VRVKWISGTSSANRLQATSPTNHPIDWHSIFASSLARHFSPSVELGPSTAQTSTPKSLQHQHTPQATLEREPLPAWSSVLRQHRLLARRKRIRRAASLRTSGHVYRCQVLAMKSIECA